MGGFLFMEDKRINEILELKKDLEKYDIEFGEWAAYHINRDILDIRMELIIIRKMLEEVQHTVMLKN